MSSNMKKENTDNPKLFEYRIKYNAGQYHSMQNNYHYYNAESAEDALDFHLAMLEKHELQVQTLSIEKYNPYSDKWEDESTILNQEV